MHIREQFLNYKINLASKMLNVNFDGSTLEEKENFYQNIKEPLRIAVEQMFTEMHIAQSAKVIRFGDGSTETDWVVAESKEEAVQYYEEVLKGTNTLEDLEIYEVDNQLEYMLYKEDEVPVADQAIFKKSEVCEGYLEVPFVYAISYALENGMTLPDIIQSFE